MSRLAWFLVGVSILGASCRGGAREELEVRHDLDPLARRFDLPCGVVAATWIAVPLYHTDERLVPTPDKPMALVVRFDREVGGACQAAAAGAPTATLTLPEGAAAAVLPVDVRATCVVKDTMCELTGARLSPPLQAHADRVELWDAIAIGASVIVRADLLEY